jgi:predicted TIM-barrel fold metal-dependent hydrolase
MGDRPVTVRPKEVAVLPVDVHPFSVDDHIIEPPHLWQDRLPAAYRDVGPRVVELDDGTQAWTFEDQIVRTVRGNTRTRDGFDDNPLGWARFDEMRPACYDPHARLVEMDDDGIWAQVNFPDFSRFAGHRFITCHDKTLAMLCTKAYNDFVLDEWSIVDRDRLIPLTVLPLWDVDECAAEVRRVAAKGSRAVAFSENPTSLGLPSVYTDHWEPLWHAVEETGLVVCLHIGSSSKLIKSSDDAPFCSVLPYVGANSMIACTDWMFSGILDRHPSIKVAFSEGGAGWVPYLLEQATDVWNGYRVQIRGQRPPREVFAEHLYVCILRDDTALRNLDVIPVDNVMWESDYPHDSTSWPRSLERLQAMLAEVPADAARKIAETNARTLFGAR